MSSNDSQDDHDHHGEHASLGSPSQMIGLHGALTPEDIQELLGGVLEDHPEEQEGHHTATAGIPNDSRAAARSERKRSREKQRRSDVNKQFSTLTDMLRQIESSNKDLFATPIWTEASFSPTNRVELMARTIHVLQTLDNSHKRQKTRVRELEEQLEQAKKAGEEAAAKAKEKMMAPMQTGQNQVVMMVPMLIGGGGAGAAPSAAAAAQSPMAFMPMAGGGESASAMGGGMPTAAMPWMMPHAMSPWGGMMMPTAAPATTATATPPNSAAAASSTSSEESKQPPASENTTTSNLAHCA